MTFLAIESLQKSFASNRVVQDFNLVIEQGEFVSFSGRAAAARPRPCAWSPASSSRIPAAS